MAVKITNKKTKSVNSRSHALNITKRKQKLNLQNVTVDGIKIKTTVREAKALKKEKYFTLCFQNKDFIIWKNIIEKCKELGFKLEDISIYDTYGNPYNKYWSKFSPKSDIYVTFKKTDKPLKSRFFKENINLEQLIYEVADYTLDVKDNNKIYDLTVAYIIWSLFYNEGTMNITDFNLKQFIKYIESHQLRREQLTLDI